MHILQRGSFLNQKKLSCRSQIWWIACQQLRGCTFALSGGCTKLLTKSPQSHLWRFKKHHSKHIFSDFFLFQQTPASTEKPLMCFWLFSPRFLSPRRLVLLASTTKYIARHSKNNSQKLLAIEDFFVLFFPPLAPLLENVCWRRLMLSCSHQVQALLFAFSIYMREWCFLIFLSLRRSLSLLWLSTFMCVHEDVDFLCSCCICDVNLSSMLLSMSIRTFYSIDFFLLFFFVLKLFSLSTFPHYNF